MAGKKEKHGSQEKDSVESFIGASVFRYVAAAYPVVNGGSDSELEFASHL